MTNFTSEPEPSHLSPAVVQLITVFCILLLSNPTHLTALPRRPLQDVNRKSTTVVESWEGSKGKQLYSHSMTRNASVTYTWAFQRTNHALDVSKHTKYLIPFNLMPLHVILSINLLYKRKLCFQLFKKHNNIFLYYFIVFFIFCVI